MQPLAGLRLVEFDGIGPVPFCGMLLAGLGAEIVRLTRGANPAWDDVGGEVMHRDRDWVIVDLKAPGASDSVLDLLAGADGLIEGFRPGVMERFGLGPARCHAVNRRLVYGRMTGYGQDGPLAAAAGHDINYVALSGALHAFGPAASPPSPPLNLVGDYAGGAMMLAVGMLSGLIEAARTGSGRVVDAAMTDGAALLTSFFHAYAHTGQWVARREANLLDGGAPFYRCYACRDGRFVAVGALEPVFFAALLRVLDVPPDGIVQFDRSSWPALSARLAAIFAQRDRDAWIAAFEGHDACVSPVLELHEAPDHPHHRARASFRTRNGIVQPSPAPRMLPAGEAEDARPAGRAYDMPEAIARWTCARD